MNENNGTPTQFTPDVLQASQALNGFTQSFYGLATELYDIDDTLRVIAETCEHARGRMPQAAASADYAASVLGKVRSLAIAARSKAVPAMRNKLSDAMPLIADTFVQQFHCRQSMEILRRAIEQQEIRMCKLEAKLNTPEAQCEPAGGDGPASVAASEAGSPPAGGAQLAGSPHDIRRGSAETQPEPAVDASPDASENQTQA